jgi:hypothetical protein
MQRGKKKKERERERERERELVACVPSFQGEGQSDGKYQFNTLS